MYSNVFESKGPETYEFSMAAGLALNGKGDMWVLDMGSGWEGRYHLDEFTENEEFVRSVGFEGSGAGQLLKPVGVAVDSKGNVWVADTGNNRVAEFNEKGEFVKTFGFGVSNGEGKFQVCTSRKRYCRFGTWAIQQAGTYCGELKGDVFVGGQEFN